MRLPRPALAWALVAVLLVWLTNTAAQMASALPMPNQQGGLMAGIGIGVGAAAAGIGWFVKLFRGASGGASNGEELHRVRRVEEVLGAMAADLKAQTRLLEELVRSAQETREYQRAGREAIQAIHRMEQKP